MDRPKVCNYSKMDTGCAHFRIYLFSPGVDILISRRGVIIRYIGSSSEFTKDYGGMEGRRG